MPMIKTNELMGAALDWAVAKCEGPNSVAACYYDEDDLPMCLDEAPHMEWQPSIEWAQGGPIIEMEGIGLDPYADYPRWQAFTPAPEQLSGHCVCFGPTPLIAAMRCYVASTLGDTIDIPSELI